MDFGAFDMGDFFPATSQWKPSYKPLPNSKKWQKVTFGPQIAQAL
jgi:hypothetical protein